MKLAFFPPSFTHSPINCLHSTCFKKYCCKRLSSAYTLALASRPFFNANANLCFHSPTRFIDWWLCCFRCVCERHDASWCSRTFSRHSQYLGHSDQLWWEQASYIWRLNTCSETADWYQILQGYQKTVQTWTPLQRKGKIKTRDSDMWLI